MRLWYKLLIPEFEKRGLTNAMKILRTVGVLEEIQTTHPLSTFRNITTLCRLFSIISWEWWAVFHWISFFIYAGSYHQIKFCGFSVP
jgi:hypothetical protein